MVSHRRTLHIPALGAGLLILVAMLTTGGQLLTAGDVTSVPTQLPTTLVDIVFILAGGGALATAIVTRRGGSGTLSVLLFGAVAALSAVSIAWSVAPDQSWEESGRTVAYLCIFGAAVVAARHHGSDSRPLLVALTWAALAMCVWALAVKALDLNLYGQPLYGPLLSPFGYWNSTGVTGALALPGLVWLASAPGGSRLARGGAVAGIALAATVVALTYSRSAVAAAALATLVLLVGLRARRRAAAMLALGLGAAAPVWIYALTDHAIAGDLAGSLYGGAASIDRGGAELLLGGLLLVLVAVLTVAGAALSGYLDRARPEPRRIAQIDRALLGLVAVLPVAAVIWLLVNRRGPFGELSHLWRALTDVGVGRTGGGASRLASVANSRSAYWRQALSIFDHHVLLGAGVATFAPAYLHYLTAALTPGQLVQNAHSYVFDTLAGLGLVGALLNAGLLASWCAGARRAIRRPPVDRDRPASVTETTAVDREFDARWALIATVVAFGVSSSLDWTWYFPGVAVPALIAAGWIAGTPRPGRSTATSDVAAGPGRPAAAPPRPLASRPGAILALTAVLAVTLAIAWESYQPARSARAVNASLAAQVRGDDGAALADARTAVSIDRLSIAALSRLANLYGALGEPSLERAELVRATHVQPANPQPFIDLGSYLVCRGDHHAAMAPLTRATRLDITDSQDQSQMLAAAQHGRRPTQLCPTA